MANGNETNFSSETGFERELQQLLRFLDDSNIENVVFVTTDVHFPANILYDIDANNDGDLIAGGITILDLMDCLALHI